MPEVRYMVIIHVNDEFRSLVTTLRQSLDRSGAADIPAPGGRVNLHESPHLTLVPPFVAKQGDESALIEAFQKWKFPAETITTAEADIIHWTRTGSVPFFAFNDEVLQTMYRSLYETLCSIWVYTETPPEKAFVPHITIVYGTDEEEAAKVVETVSAMLPKTLTLAQVSLCRIHKESGWEVIATKQATA